MIPFFHQKALSTKNNYPKVIPKIKKNKKSIFKHIKLRYQKLNTSHSLYQKTKIHAKSKRFLINSFHIL